MRFEYQTRAQNIIDSERSIDQFVSRTYKHRPAIDQYKLDKELNKHLEDWDDYELN